MDATTVLRQTTPRAAHARNRPPQRGDGPNRRPGLLHPDVRMATGPLTWNAPYRSSITRRLKDKEEGLFHVKQALSDNPNR
jgi:hypothetical protein